MKTLTKFESWGIRKRELPEYNYSASWIKGYTVRHSVDKELPPSLKEFYDVSLGTMCNICVTSTIDKSFSICPKCCAGANRDGELYLNILDSFKKWMDSYPEDEISNGITYTKRPFSAAIGSTGEATLHPDFIKLLKLSFDYKVAPCYTTNGITLTYGTETNNTLLQATKDLVAGVAVSVDAHVPKIVTKTAITRLLMLGNTKVNLHHVITDFESIKRFLNYCEEYPDIDYHVLLPYMENGKYHVQAGVFEKLIGFLLKTKAKNIAFGAHFYPYLIDSIVHTWLYEPESLSCNVLLKPDNIIFTKNSFDLNPIWNLGI